MTDQIKNSLISQVHHAESFKDKGVRAFYLTQIATLSVLSAIRGINNPQDGITEKEQLEVKTEIEKVAKL